MKKTVLKNGLTVITKEDENAVSTTLSFFANVGSYDEKEFPAGIAHFVEHMLFKGTDKRTSRDINEEIESVGGMMNAYTSFEVTKYYTKVPYDQWKIGADILLDVLWNAKLPEKELEKERMVIFEEIKMKEDSPRQQAFDHLFRELHKKTKERQSIIGTRESVASITRNDLLTFISTFYQPDNITFVATGHIDHDELVRFIESFKPSRTSQTKKQNKEDLSITLENKAIKIKRDISQAHVAYALNTVDIHHKDLPALQLISKILGGGMSSRFFRIIREERGLAYSVSLSSLANSDSGFLVGYVGTDKEKIEEVKTVIKTELNRLKEEKVTDKELNKAINSVKGSFMMSLEGNAAYNEFLGRKTLLNQPTDPMYYINEIQKITKEDIQKVAKKYITNDNYLFVEVIPN